MPALNSNSKLEISNIFGRYLGVDVSDVFTDKILDERKISGGSRSWSRIAGRLRAHHYHRQRCHTTPQPQQPARRKHASKAAYLESYFPSTGKNQANELRINIVPKIFSGDDYVREAQVTKRHSTTTRVEEGTTDNLIEVFFLLLLTNVPTYLLW